MISETRIKDIIDECKGKGFTVRLRDIAFMFLKEHIDEELAYKCLFHEESSNINEYTSSAPMIFLASHFKYNVFPQERSNKDDGESITADDNKRAMETLIKDLTRAIENDEYTDERNKITAQKTVADLRIKLGDKFNVNEAEKDQIVIVEKKYNSVCTCGREISVPTKEELMKKYHLIEKI